MNSKKYIELAIKTENQDFKSIKERRNNIAVIRLDHASKGMITEVGEFVDELKKWEYYGKTYTTTNLVEELGDLMWYIAIACDTLNISLEEIMERNIAKLKARYGEKFNEEGAINRDLETERIILAYNQTKEAIIHYRIPGGSIISPCGTYAANFSYSQLEVTCVDCKEKIYG